MANLSKPQKGQSIVETVVGIIFLIPIVLFLLDIAVLVMANTANDNLAKSVARAAASAKDSSSGEGTAQAAVNAARTTADTMAESSIINKPGGSFLTGFCWNQDGTPNTQGTSWPSSSPQPSTGNVAVVTTMKVKVPVPFPFLPSEIDFHAKAVEPVVSCAAGASFLLAKDGAFDPSKNNHTNGKGPNQNTQMDGSLNPNAAGESDAGGTF